MPSYEDRARFIVNVLFVFLIAVIILIALRLVVPYTLPFLIGFFIAFVLKPVTAFITKKTPFRRKSVSIAVIALFYIALTSIVFSVLAMVFSQLGRLLHTLPQLYSEGLEPILDSVNRFIYGILAEVTPKGAGQLGEFFAILPNAIKNSISSLSAAAVEWITDAIKGLPMFLTTLIFTVISSILISADYLAVSGFLLRQLPLKYRHMVLDAKNFMVDSLFKMLKAYVIIMAITMVELSLGLWLLGVDLFLAIAVIIALLDILPLIGTGGILIPWGLIELGRGNLFLGVGLLVLLVIVTIVRNIIEPKIIGAQIGLHPVVTIAAMYLGLKSFGFLGLVLAPLSAILIKYFNDSGKIRVYK